MNPIFFSSLNHFTSYINVVFFLSLYFHKTNGNKLNFSDKHSIDVPVISNDCKENIY